MGHLLIIFGIWDIELQVLEHVKCFGFVDGTFWGGGGGGVMGGGPRQHFLNNSYN